MSSYTFGFIGTGNMGSALAKSIRKCGGASILLANRTRSKAEALAAELSADVGSIFDVAHKARYIFLGVKPQMMSGVLAEISPILRERLLSGDRFVLVSMAAGLTMETVQSLTGADCPIIRIMPNTPVAVCHGVTLYTYNSLVSPDELSCFKSALACSGELTELSEPLFDAGSALSGCGPAFVDMFIEALADGGVRAGLPRNVALRLAEQMIEGAAALAVKTGKHPGELKDAVCSPAGSTIEGVSVLESRAFRSALSDAVVAAYKRTKELGKQ